MERVIILETDVHCLRCARKICDAVRNMHGVQNVWASVDKRRVEVTCSTSLDASLLWRRIQSMTRKKPVTILSDGSAAAEELPAGQMVHLGPTPPPPQLGYQYSSYPYGYGGYGGGGWSAPPALHQYVPGNAFLPYDARQNYGMMTANDAPPCYRDDGPSGCCTMQ